MKTKQIVFTEINKAELLETTYELPLDNQITVSLQFSAISNGTEKANIMGIRNETRFSEEDLPIFPRFCGYSASGIVIDKGRDIEDIEIGDRVVVFWGQHKKRVNVGRHQVVKIPDGISFEEASMAFISTFPLAAIRKTKLEIGESAIVMGLGILGIFAVQELKAAGAIPIIAVDPVEERRELALRMGADYALDPTDEDFEKRVKELTEGGANVAIEVTGLGQGLIQVLDCMAKFGRVALLGCTRNSDFKIDYYRKVHAPGITIVGAHTGARPKESYPAYWTHEDDIKAVLKMILGKRLNFREIISEIHKPEEAPDVYKRLISDKNFPVGVLFDWRDVE